MSYDLAAVKPPPLGLMVVRWAYVWERVRGEWRVTFKPVWWHRRQWQTKEDAQRALDAAVEARHGLSYTVEGEGTLTIV